MNKPVFYIVCFVVGFSQNSFGQENLVRNGSFEDTVSYVWSPFYEICEYWRNASYGTIDYSTPYCVELVWTPWCAPDNYIFGIQEAKDGVAYAGLVLYERVFPDINPEMIQGELSEPLEAGATYKLEFYINLADFCDFKTCNLDVFLESELSLCANCLPPIIPRFSVDITDVDSAEWYEKSIVFEALGGEQFIYFSNYMNATDATNCEIDRGDWTNVYNSAYYFIDDVSIVKIETSSLDNLEIPETTSINSLEIPNVITPNGDGVNESFFIPLDKNGLVLEGVSYSILNRWGQVVFDGNAHTHWNGTDHLGDLLPEGVYYYIINQTHKGRQIQKTGFIHLVR